MLRRAGEGMESDCETHFFIFKIGGWKLFA
jgi:hypothetical protein